MGLRAMVSRCSLTLAVCMVSLAPLQAQTPKGSPDPDGRALWIGEWTLTGTGKSAPEQPEYGLTCRLHGRLILVLRNVDFGTIMLHHHACAPKTPFDLQPRTDRHSRLAFARAAVEPMRRVVRGWS